MKRIFLFPGQGSQYVGMGKDLHDQFSLVREIFEEAEDALKINIKKICFDGPESKLKLTQYTQPALLTVSVATVRLLLQETEIRPQLLAGHSLGEFSALVTAQVLSLADAVCLVYERGKAMQEAVPVGRGAMAAFLGVSAHMISDLCEEVNASFEASQEFVAPANFNGGGQVVVSGTLSAVKKSIEVASTKGIRYAKLLEVSAPFHCKLMKPVACRLEKLFEGISFSSPQIPYIANVDAAIYRNAVGVRDRLVRQIPNPVQWEASMELLSKESIEEAFEIGPGKVLTSLLRRINKNIKTENIETSKDIKRVSKVNAS